MKADRITRERGKHCLTAGTKNQVALCFGMHVEVAAANQILCRGNVVSCVYARPFDRMPVEVTHLRKAPEGVAPTEVRSSPTVLRLRPCLDV